MKRAGILSVCAVLPEQVRTNDDYRERFPELVAQMEERALARLFSAQNADGGETNAFDRAMAPYLGDAFRGTVERRVLAPGERILDLEVRAARAAIEHSGLSTDAVGMTWVGSFLPDSHGVGHAAFLVRELGLSCPAYNLETACSTALIAIDDAALRVAAGRVDAALVVVSCSYSRHLDENDTLGWFMGDAAGAFVIGPVSDGRGAQLLATHAVHTAETCGTFRYDLDVDASGHPRLVLRCSPETGRILRDTSEAFIRACCEAACEKAEVRMREVDALVVNTPTPWFADLAANVLGIPPEKTLSVYDRIGNVGPALLPVNLHVALTRRALRPGATVLLYTIGSVSTAAAAVFRWGEVASGPPPL